MTDLKELCKGEQGHQLFPVLRILTITKCNNLMVAVPGTLLLDMLQEIRVKDCDQMEQVFRDPSHPRPRMFYRDKRFSVQHFFSLTCIELVNLPGLRCIWSSNVRLRFPCLRNLEITNCSKLETVFPSPSSQVCQDSLHFRIMEILECLLRINPRGRKDDIDRVHYKV